MALTNEQLNALIDNDLRPLAEKIRSMKIRLASIAARAPQYTDYPDTADAITLTRSDAATLPTLTSADMRNFLYAIADYKTDSDGIDAVLVEKFCVRSADVVG